MNTNSAKLITFAALLAVAAPIVAQQPAATTTPAPRHEDTEVYEPVPPVVTPGATCGSAPSDAIILFDGKNEDEWVSSQDHSPAKWVVGDNILTVSKEKGVGNIETKRSFRNYQLHVEWRIPENITGSSQARAGLAHCASGSIASSCAAPAS